MARVFRRALLISGLLGLADAAGRNVTRMKGLLIKSWDGTILTADAHIPQATSPNELFPIIIFANSWDMPQIEYLVQTVELAEEGYLVLEYETRGWYTSGGKVECAGPADQRDSSAVIDYMLNQSQWQPDPQNVALAGISYGAGLALVSAARDPRVKTVVAMSGWADLERALFEDSTPNLVWGEILTLSGRIISGDRLDPMLMVMWKQLLIGNETAFHDWVQLRGVITYADSLRDRKVPLFLSNNFEDRIFKPQNMFEFFESHTGPKKMLLNQGIHATAEIGGLILIPYNHIWMEAKKWLAHYLQGKPMEDPAPLVDMQLRSDKNVREMFMNWPDSRVAQLQYTMTPRTALALHGGLVPPARAEADPTDNLITFARETGISAGFPVIGEILQVFVDHRITSNLLLAPRDHSIWYYAPVSRTMRLCGTPKISVDFTPSASKWQMVVYLLSVNALDQGTLLSHGVMSCWNCTAGQRMTRQFDLRTLCDDVNGGLGLAINMFSELYEPANTDSDLTLTFHYSQDSTLIIPEVSASGSEEGASTVMVV